MQFHTEGSCITWARQYKNIMLKDRCNLTKRLQKIFHRTGQVSTKICENPDHKMSHFVFWLANCQYDLRSKDRGVRQKILHTWRGKRLISVCLPWKKHFVRILSANVLCAFKTMQEQNISSTLSFFYCFMTTHELFHQ